MNQAETLVYDGNNAAPSDIIECKDALTPCVINCTVGSSCREKEIHCHRTAPQPCTIQVGTAASGTTHVGRDSFYYTHRAPTAYIIALGGYAVFSSVVYAHEAMKSKLFISAEGLRAFAGGTIYAPVGKGSLLSLKCGSGRDDDGDTCADMWIYEDWTTEVQMEGMRTGFKMTEIRNIFDDSPLNISRNDSNYIGLNSAYRAPVFLSSRDADTFNGFKYFGHNHGNWTLHGTTLRSFGYAFIEATADIPPYNGSSGYDIKLIGTSSVDSLIGQSVFELLTLNASQSGANIYAKVTDMFGLRGAVIYAKNAHSVEIYCNEGGGCDALMVECPYSADSTCKIQCDDDPDTDCSNMKIYTDDTCSRADVFCDGVRCNFGVNSSATKVFCGFDQNETYCQLQSNTLGVPLCEGSTMDTTEMPSISTSDPSGKLFSTTDIPSNPFTAMPSISTSDPASTDATDIESAPTKPVTSSVTIQTTTSGTTKLTASIAVTRETSVSNILESRDIIIILSLVVSILVICVLSLCILLCIRYETNYKEKPKDVRAPAPANMNINQERIVFAEAEPGHAAHDEVNRKRVYNDEGQNEGELHINGTMSMRSTQILEVVNRTAGNLQLLMNQGVKQNTDNLEGDDDEEEDDDDVLKAVNEISMKSNTTLGGKRTNYID